MAVLLLGLSGVSPAEKIPEISENVTDYKPLSGEARAEHLVQETLLAPTFYAAILGGAFLHHVSNSPPEWGQGAKGYSRRAASSLGLLSIQAGITETSAGLLRLEPRYIHSGSRSFGPRLGHAILWTFVTWDSDRHIRPNIPIVAGAYGSGMLQTMWYPDRYTALHDGVRFGSQQLMIAVGHSIFHEFTPDIKRLFHLR